MFLRGLIILLIITSFGFDGYQFYTLRQEKISLENEVADLTVKLAMSEGSLTKSQSDNTNLSDALHTEQETNNYFQNQIQDISSTVGVLEKLSKTDTELLKKYSKIYFLNENYIPKQLTDVDPKYLYDKNKQSQMLSQVYPFMQGLLDASAIEGVSLQIISAYRSFGTQAILKSGYKIIYGAGTANSFSADQGYSEHQLGTTVDFTTPKIGATFSGFDKTPEYKWLLSNAYKYGFIMSYPKENTYYIFEPWHFRFVGLALAKRLHDQNLYFYALDQRDINQYLANLFDQ